MLYNDCFADESDICMWIGLKWVHHTTSNWIRSGRDLPTIYDIIQFFFALTDFLVYIQLFPRVIPPQSYTNIC